MWNPVASRELKVRYVRPGGVAFEQKRDFNIVRAVALTVATGGATGSHFAHVMDKAAGLFALADKAVAGERGGGGGAAHEKSPIA
jgi:hypothetical protein